MTSCSPPSSFFPLPRRSPRSRRPAAERFTFVSVPISTDYSFVGLGPFLFWAPRKNMCPPVPARRLLLAAFFPEASLSARRLRDMLLFLKGSDPRKDSYLGSFVLFCLCVSPFSYCVFYSPSIWSLPLLMPDSGDEVLCQFPSTSSFFPGHPALLPVVALESLSPLRRRFAPLNERRLPSFLPPRVGTTLSDEILQVCFPRLYPSWPCLFRPLHLETRRRPYVGDLRGNASCDGVPLQQPTLSSCSSPSLSGPYPEASHLCHFLFFFP